MSNLASQFHTLHEGSDLLILPNAWDAGSARLFEDAGAKAIATTSAGVAWALGYQDGNTLPIEKLASVVYGITRIVRVPVSIDIEAGYTDEPQNVAKVLKHILDAGAVGINIEDGEGPTELLARKIEQVRKTAEAAGVNLFINARTDVYLNAEGAPEEWVAETVKRAAVYREAGANGIFVPGVSEASDIRRIADAIQLPLNVMAVPSLPSAKELSSLGARRLSAGGSITQVVWNQAAAMAKQFLNTGDTRVVATEPLSYSKLQSLFAQ